MELLIRQRSKFLGRALDEVKVDARPFKPARERTLQARRRRDEQLSKSMSVDPSSFRIDPDPEDAFNLSRVAENESVFSASRVNLMVPKNLAGSQAALQVSDSARSTS